MHSKAKKQRRGISRLCFFIVLIIFVFFWDIILSGKTLSTSRLVPGAVPEGPYISSDSKTSARPEKPVPPFSFDLTGNAWINEPNPYIVKRNISDSVIPAWNNDEGLGMPIIANPNTEVFNPLKSLLNFSPTPFLQDMFFLLRLLVMGIFTYLFLLELGLSNIPCLFGAVFFMLSGYSIWWINLHPLSSMTYVPGLFYFYEKAVSEKDRRNNIVLPCFCFSLFFAFSVFGGKLPVVIMGMMLLFIYAVCRNIKSAIDQKSVTGTLQAVKPTRDKSRGFLPASPNRGECGGETSTKLVLPFPLKARLRPFEASIPTINGGAFWQRRVKSSVPVKLIILTITGIIMASALILPFAELLERSSLIARAVRTGASSHTLPVISSVTVWQPLFLGLKDYFYGSWLKWSPHYMMPYAGITVLLLYLYAAFNKRVLAKVIPFCLFSLFLFLKIYGLIPNDLFIGIPILGSMNFIKYHGMFYFSLAVISAYSLEDIRINRSSGFYFAVILVSVILLAYFYSLYSLCPPERINHITRILAANLCVLFVFTIIFYLSGKNITIPLLTKDRHISAAGDKRERKFPVLILFVLMLAELWIYMPKTHPDRIYPYAPPPYLNLIIEDHPYRIAGDRTSVPPLVSNVFGLHDLRAIDVLFPDDYYQFYENLIGFSAPYTKNSDPLVAATSPISDLTGVKYILSRDKLDIKQLQKGLRNHLEGLRTIRFFNSMKIHSITGGSRYGYYDTAGEGRFSFFFPQRFRFESKINITGPYLFVGLALSGSDTESGVRMSISGRVYNISANSENWTDRWIDLSEFKGKTVEIVFEGFSPGSGEIVLGSFGLSKGRDWEKNLLNSLNERHLKEFSHIKYRGMYEGIHIYENENVMPRAFMLHKTKTSESTEEMISELQNGFDFRNTALVSGKDLLSVISGSANRKDTVKIEKYSSGNVEINVDTGGGLLVLGDLYYPGWKVTVNGKEKEIIRTFGSLRGVAVPEGKSRVVFYYRPMSLYAGIVISFISLTVWILLLFLKGRKSKKQNII